MSEVRRALLLIGSPRGPKGVSHQYAVYLARQLERRGLASESVMANRALRSIETAKELVDSARKADVLAIITPLYVDCLPSHLLRVLELLHRDRQQSPGGASQRLMGIINCGFPEGLQTATALRILKKFATESGFAWAGGLGIGAGAMAEGRSLESLGGMASHLTQALDLSAEALAAGRLIPDEAAALAGKSVSPGWLYTLGGNLGWVLRARKNGVLSKINARPYQ